MEHLTSELSIKRLAKLAGRMREVSEHFLQKLECGANRWFSGPEGLDFFIYTNRSGSPIRYEFTFEDNIVCWSKRDGLSSGVLREWGEETLYRRGRSKVEHDVSFDFDKAAAAIEILGAMAEPAELVSDFIEKIKPPKKIIGGQKEIDEKRNSKN